MQYINCKCVIFVFSNPAQNNKYFYASIEKDFTILAPTNVAAMKPSPNMADKERVRQLLLNHIVLGQAVQSSQLRKSLTLTTLGGSRLHFQPAKGIRPS